MIVYNTYGGSHAINTYFDSDPNKWKIFDLTLMLNIYKQTKDKESSWQKSCCLDEGRVLQASKDWHKKIRGIY